MPRYLGWSAVVTADVGALVASWRSLPDAARLLGDPRTAVAAGVDRPIATLCAAGLWCAAVWVTLGLLAAAGSRLPGATGRHAATVSRLVLPRVLQRLLAGSAGLTVLLAPVAARAATSDPLPAPSWPVSAAAASPAPIWPSTPQASTPAAARSTAAPQTEAPGGEGSGAPGRPATPSRTPHSTPQPATAPPGAGTTRVPTAVPTATVAVRPGDSLWLIAARRLGAGSDARSVASAWPRWYAANRDVIGDDPALITPGQVLHAPAPHQEEHSP